MSKIEWTDETINPLGWGCYGPLGTPEAPRVCSYCYARRFAARNTRGCELCAKFIPHWHDEQLEKINHWRKPRRIFIQSMGDLFHPYTPKNQILTVLAVAGCFPRHTFQFLTKNPKRLKDFNPWPSNCWVGTTVTNQADADERLPWLLKVDAPVRFVSHEPLMGEIDMVNTYLKGSRSGRICPVCGLAWGHDDLVGRGRCRGVDRAIIGAMTGPGPVRPKPEWVQGLVEQYRSAGVPIFLKDNLYQQPLGWTKKIQEWPKP